MEKNNMSNGKIAVILCNYNDSRFLIDVVGKIARQAPDEFIIVDDRSTDSSLKVIASLQKKHDRIDCVGNDGVHSPFGSFIKGCQSTDAEYVACFSADDYPHGDYLWRMKAAIKDFPFVDLYTCNTDVIREGERYERILLPFTAYISPAYAVKIFQAGYAKNINQCGIVIKRQHVIDCWEGGGKNTEVNFDCMYSFYAAFDKGFVNVGKNLTTYRSYPNSFGAAGNAKKVKRATEVHKRFYRLSLTTENGATGNFAYIRAMKSGIWGAKARWMAIVALWGIMKMPKWARRIFYRWFYSYDQVVEKL